MQHTDFDTAPSADELAVLQRRTMNVLRLGVVPGYAAIAGMVAVVSLLAKDLLGGSDRLAGMGSAGFTTGAAIASVPVAAAMRRRGRRGPLAAALAIGALGALIAATAGQVGWFWLFIVGMLCFGAGQTATLQSRYVAADLSPGRDQARAIGAIVWIGALGAIGGPILSPFEQDVGEALGFDEYVGPFLFAAVLFVVASVVYLVLMRPDPLAVLGAIDPDAERRRPLQQVRQSYAVIRNSPGAMLGLVAMAASQAAMVGVMTMTPPHMKDHDQGDLSAFVIAAHVAGMFGFAPLVGRFVDRVGSVRAIQTGAVVLGIGTVSAVVAGYVPALIFVGLFLLGLGWNIGLIGGTSLLTASVPQASRVESQGTGDLTLSLCGAVAAFGSGFVKQGWGYHVLANMATVVAGCLLVYAWITQVRLDRSGFRAAS